MAEKKRKSKKAEKVAAEKIEKEVKKEAKKAPKKAVEKEIKPIEPEQMSPETERDMNQYYYNDEHGLALDYYVGRKGHEKDVDKAVKILKKGVTFGDGNAQYSLAMFDFDAGKNEDGIKKLEKAIKMGVSDAFGTLFNIYSKGAKPADTTSDFDFTELKDEEKAGKLAIETSEKAAKAKKKDKMSGLQHCYSAAAWAYLKGCGVEKDIEKAKEWLNTAKERSPFGMGSSWTRAMDKEIADAEK